jgi:VanZ family protein
MWTSLRPITAILVAIETLVAIYYLVVFHQPGRSNAIANIAVDSVTLIVAAIWLVFVLPALILVIRNTRLELALGLSLAAIVAFAANAMIF